MSKRVCILGAGSWGLALSHLLCLGGYSVTLWEYLAADYRLLQETRSNPSKLESFRLDDAVTLTDNAVAAVAGAEVVVVAVSSQFVRPVMKSVARQLGTETVVVSAAKGLERGSLSRMTEVIADESGFGSNRLAALSGPSHAEEVVKDVPTTVVVASESESTATELQDLFSIDHFRVYKAQDVVGVELGGSLKNIIAIASGIADGLELGDNTKGALLTRGLAEITRLGMAMGARPETFAGLSGVGDLVTTCFSRHSRNRYVGEKIGRGERLEDVIKGMTMVAEGVETTRSGFQLAERHQVEMPITEEVYRVLFEDKDAREALGNLMDRRLRAEVWQ